MTRRRRGAFPLPSRVLKPVEPSSFRPDVQALRAIAVSAVVLYHAGVPWLPGGYVGVDVFFVISGFLIVGLLWRQIEQTGRIQLRAFFARRIRRLLPMASLVALAILVAAHFFLPLLTLPRIAREAAASQMMIVNLYFARAGTQYSGDPWPSPFQHYWSLNLEEQFYLLLPFVLLGCAFLIASRWRRAVAIAVMLGLSAASLIACVALTSTSFSWAFFSLGTRAWELGLGGVLALCMPLVARTPRWLRSAAVAAGLLTVAAAVTLFDEHTVFPGFMALIPVSGALLVIAGGVGNRGRLATALAWRPIGFVGDISYSLYLWHWPLLVIPAIALGGELDAWTRVLLVAAALALSAASYPLVELRFQRLPRRADGPWQPFRLAAVLVAATLAASLGLAQTVPRLDSGRDAVPFSMALSGTLDSVATFVPANVVPTLEGGISDIPVADTETCTGGEILAGPGDCVFGDVASGRRLVLFGDSHAAQWFSPLEAVATDNGLSFVSLTKAGCPAASVTFRASDKGPTSGCARWREAAIRRIRQMGPALIVVADYVAGYAGRLSATDPGARDTGARDTDARDTGAADPDAPNPDAPDTGAADTDAALWRSALNVTLAQLPVGSRIMILGDTPNWPTDPNACLSEHLNDAQVCALPVGALSSFELIRAEQSAATANGASYVPTIGWLCGARCSPLAWNVLVYRDLHHLTNEMAKTLQRPLAAAVLAQLG